MGYVEKIPLRRRDVGIVGAVIAMTQIFSSFQSSQTLMNEISKFKEEFQQSQIEREQFFVRKTDVSLLSNKMDRMNDQLVQMSEQIKILKTLVKQDYEASNDIIGCSKIEANLQQGASLSL